MNKKIIPVFIPFFGCIHKCIYCEQKIITGYFKPENVFEIIKEGISWFSKESEKEVAFYGGTFANLPVETQKKFLDIANSFSKYNVNSIRISTSPDSITEKECKFLKENNVSTVELGIQSTSDIVLEKNGRKYTKEICFNTVKLLKKYKFTIGAQIMSGLYYSKRKDDLQTLNDIIKMKPDIVRIYPTVIIKNTKLEELYKNKEYIPRSLAETIVVVSKMYEKFNKNNIKVIRMGLHSDVSLTSNNNIVAGPYHNSFGHLVLSYLMYKKIVKIIILDNLYLKKEITIKCSTKNESKVRGYKNQNIKRLKEHFKNLDIIIKKINSDDVLVI